MPQAEANVVSQDPGEHLAQRNQLVQQVWPSFRGWAAPCRGLGPGVTGAWGPGPSGFGPGLPDGARPKAAGPVFRHSEKSPGEGLAKGWESAETAAADVGAWREAGTGYPPLPPPPPPTPPAFLGCKGERKRVFTLSVTETIQHAPQGRRTISLMVFGP